MTRREQLLEQYEDALFALLMDEVAKSEGEKLLEENERLKQDPNSDIPDSVMKRCYNVINREFSKKNAVALCRTSIKVFNKIAVFALVVTLLFTGAFAVSESLRVQTFNLLIETFERNTDYRFTSSSYSENDLGFEVGWLPEGFVITKQNSGQHAAWADYEGPDGQLLSINVSVLNDNGVIKEITVNGLAATLIIKDSVYQMVIPLPEKKQIRLVVYSSLSDFASEETEAEFLRIVESITWT